MVRIESDTDIDCELQNAELFPQNKTQTERSKSGDSIKNSLWHGNLEFLRYRDEKIGIIVKIFSAGDKSGYHCSTSCGGFRMAISFGHSDKP